MPTHETVETFMAAVESGDYIGAIERFYDPAASMQENNDPPRAGRDLLVEGERKVMGAFKSIVARRLAPPLIGAELVAIRWAFVFTPFEGPPFELDEIAFQTWRGERIVEEKFFYDPKQMGR
ncbi:nuclear transport factor 2 family protein [Chelatococcus reniformis]|uniref:Polyketide cyclase n=1 Tax=Chelatococcus reniformis TaxID=1494448 RepID=A0A916UIR3_9HYPH|nr:nuclear transport factor 2 family protein [Chelatococcus reniformis]GGC75081.1 polyketide cyclase [Chelatococcus reniformis]